MRYDVVVVGAGAAGLMAAACAAARGRRTLLLEKNQRPGLKILISGGGRCNLTTTRGGADLEAQYGQRRGRFLRHALRSFPPVALCALFEGLGVRLHEEDLEKIFPVSRRAKDVLDALLRLVAERGVELRLGSPVLDVRRSVDDFVLVTPQGAVRAAAVVLATGGRSYPKTGATGDGYHLCAAFGHSITPTWPALAPLVVAADWVQSLQGVVLQQTALSVLDGEGRVLRTRQRPILFTHKGLSGPAPMDLSGDVEELGGAELRFDFTPATTRDALEADWLSRARQHGRAAVEGLLPRELPERLRQQLCASCGVERSLAELSRSSRQRLLLATKDTRVFAARSLGFDHAEVTRGGVALDEVDARTMESRKQPGLFVCGELLDVDGPIGGFNFQAAFATGRLAGNHA